MQDLTDIHNMKLVLTGAPAELLNIICYSGNQHDASKLHTQLEFCLVKGSQDPRDCLWLIQSTRSINLKVQLLEC